MRKEKTPSIGVAIGAVAVVLVLVAIPYVARKARMAVTSQRLREKHQAELPPGVLEPLAVYPLGEFKLVTSPTNQRGQKERRYYVHLSIGLGYDKANTMLAQELGGKHYAIRTVVFQLLESKPKSTLDQVSEREILKQQIKLAVNRSLSQGKVSRVYFESFTLVEK